MDPVIERRSIRSYTGKEITDENLLRLIKAAMNAPSAQDERPWHYIIIDSPDLKHELYAIAPNASPILDAQRSILVCGDLQLQKARGFWVQDCAAATENILIEAKILNMGAVWLGIYPVKGRVEGIRQLLGLPEHIVPFSLVAIGYPEKEKGPGNRFDESRIHHNEWENAFTV